MRLRHWRAARRTHPSPAGPPGHGGLVPAAELLLRRACVKYQPVIWCGKDRAFIMRDSSGPVVVWWVLHRRGGGSLPARLSSLAPGGMKSRPPSGGNASSLVLLPIITAV